jgi:glycosyltransferase involved in cell wall biosynthesis
MIGVLFASAATLLLLIGFIQDYMRLRCLPRLARPDLPTAPQPYVSLLIPARNEAHTIARCLDGALRQTYTAYEVVVVDDGSTDATPIILARYAECAPRLRVVEGGPLPPGWIGKCHACQQAASTARGEWFLFLDADTVPQPELIAALLTHAQRQNFDMLTIFPFLELGSFWERLVMPPFQALIHAIFPIARLNASDARPDEIVANGQCILVRRSVYQQIGGHSAVRTEVLEDVRLAQTARAAGFRVGAAMGAQDLRVRMYTNGREVVEGLTKNAVAGYRSGGERSFWMGVRQVGLAVGPPDLLIWGVMLLNMQNDVLAWAIVLHGLVVMVVAVCFWIWLLHRFYELPWSYALLWPLGVLSYSFIALHSLWRVHSGRGVIWKGRTYVGK